MHLLLFASLGFQGDLSLLNHNSYCRAILPPISGCPYETLCHPQTECGMLTADRWKRQKHVLIDKDTHSFIKSH